MWFGFRIHFILHFFWPRRLFSSLFTNAAKNCLLKKVLLVGKKLSHGQIK
jgi:hypothetical protein